MTRDDVIKWAREAGVSIRGHYDETGSTPAELQRFAELVAAATREECAALHGHPNVLAPVGNSAWGEAYQDGWIAGTAAYRNEIRTLCEKGTT